jgi:hypothetical protein
MGSNPRADQRGFLLEGKYADRRQEAIQPLMRRSRGLALFGPIAKLQDRNDAEDDGGPAHRLQPL